MFSAISKKFGALDGIVLAILAYALLSLGDACVKKLSQSHDIIYVAFYNNIVSTLALLVLCLFLGGPKKLVQTHCLKLHLLRALTFLCVFLSFLYAISNMPIARTYSFLLTQPFILAILAHFIAKEHIGPHRVFAICGGFIGVLIVLRPGFAPLELAALSALLSAFLFACGNMISKYLDRRDHWMTYMFYLMLVQTPILTGILFYTGGFEAGLPDTYSLPWFLVSGISYTLGLPLLVLAVQRIDAAVFGGLEFTALVWGTLFGFLIFAEIPDHYTVAGAFIIVLSGLYLVYRERQAHKSLKAP